MRKRERGAGNIGCLIGLVVLALGIIVAMKAIPPKVAVAEFNDFCVREAESASLPRHSDKIIADRILHKAHELALPVSATSIKVRRNSVRVFVEVKYRVDIEFPFYTYKWDIEHKIERVLF